MFRLTARPRSAFFISIAAAALLMSACGVSDTGAQVKDTGNKDPATPTSTPASDFRLPVEDGADGDALTFTGAETVDGSLVVHFKAAYEGIEPVGDKYLLVDGERIEARMDIHSNNDVDLYFDGIDQVAGAVVIDMVNLTEPVEIEARLGDGSFTLPDGTEATFSFADINGTEFRYHTAELTSSAVSFARISKGDTSFGTRGSGTIYSAQGQVRNPRISFQAGAEELLLDPDTVLSIFEIRRAVRYEITLSGSE